MREVFETRRSGDLDAPTCHCALEAVVRITKYADIDEARAAAGRLAEEPE